MDAANVDLKGFTEDFYRDVCSGHLAAGARHAACTSTHETDVWLEITTLLIPGRERLRRGARRAERAGSSSTSAPTCRCTSRPSIPTSRCCDRPPTPPATLAARAAIALGNGLRYVYTGNVHDPRRRQHLLPGCGELLIERDWYRGTSLWGPESIFVTDKRLCDG